MLVEEDAEYILNLEPSVFNGSDSEKFDWIVANNTEEERRKNGERDEATIRQHAAQGIGFETYLLKCTPFFSPAAPIVKDARKEINFNDRMRDLRYWKDSQYVQLKTVSKLFGNSVYISEATWKSINKCVSLNSFFIFGIAKHVQSTYFEYSPSFAISSEIILRAMCEKESSHYINLDRMSKYPKYFQPLCKELLDV